MGCGGSADKTNAAFAVCSRAFDNKKPVDLAKLRAAIAKVPAAELSERCGSWGWSALDAVVLNKAAQPEALELLLGAGADAFNGATEVDALHNSPFWKAVKFERPEEVRLMLSSFAGDAAAWDKVMLAVSKPPRETSNIHGIAAGVWVRFEGRLAKTQATLFNDGASALAGGADTLYVPVQFEDDATYKSLPRTSLEVLPALPAAVKPVVLQAAAEAGAGEERLAALRAMREGSYGQAPSRDAGLGVCDVPFF